MSRNIFLILMFAWHPLAGVAKAQEQTRSSLMDLENQIQMAYRKVANATVAVRSKDGIRSYGSGAVIQPDGLVLATGHHQLDVQTPVIVLLGDGRKASGKVLGVHEPYDISLIRLDQRGPWPFVKLGNADQLSVDEPCIALGFPVGYRDRRARAHGQDPEDDRTPLLRIGRVLRVSATRVLTSAPISGGDSGGPLFTLEGEMVGVHGLLANEIHGTGHARVKLYRESRELLLAGRHVRQGDLSGAFPAANKPVELADATFKSVVELRAEGQRVAFGVIVDATGLLITKRSNLKSPPTCRLWDGREFETRIVAGSREYDLALLKVDARKLTAVLWSERAPRPGMLLAAIGNETPPLAYGAVGTAAAALEGERGYILFSSEPTDGDNGIRVTRVMQSLQAVLKVGDVITHVEGTPTRKGDDFLRVRDSLLKVRIVGEGIGVTVNRSGQTLDVTVPIEAGDGTPVGRNTGFPSVFIHTASIRSGRLQELTAADLGAPVVGTDGCVMGISIGMATHNYNYALPASNVRHAIAELMKKAATK